MHSIASGQADAALRILFGAGIDTTSAPRWRHVWHDDDGSISLKVATVDPTPEHSTPRYLLRAPGQADFLLDPPAACITVDAEPGLADNTLEHLLLDQAIPRLLAGRGHLVVHASLVHAGQHTVAFLGRSGWGKSTLAALLHSRGLPALCDDCAMLELGDNRVSATPSYPGLRLYADSIAQAPGIAPGVGPVSDYTDKQRIIELALDPALLEPQPLAALYLLDDPENAVATAQIEPISAAAACMALIEHGFRLDPTDPVRTTRQLGQASAAAQAVPAFLLRHPRDFARQEALIALLLAHFDSIGHTQP
ncbi:MAG: hypothetical protein K8F33_06235 [Thermomonas sp.]|nr:hypothetical protein [Thermomonas sp.]